jgi:hypothetical protein
MKKLISFVLWAFFALSLFWFSFSDSVLDYLDNIWDNILFGYRPSTDVISVDAITSTSITIESPVLQDEFDDIIDNYTLMYGPNTLSDIIDDPTLISSTREKIFSNLDLDGESSFTMNLTTSDNINASTIYYLVSIPRDWVWTLWEISNEICFRLSDQTYGEWDDCVSWDATSHSAWADMNLANISHTINWSNVTLRWIALNGSNTIDIFLWNEETSTFNKLSTVNMSSEIYSFNLTRNGEHIVKFIPNNWWTEKNYTFNVVWLSSADEPTWSNTTVTPVVVWPKENVIAILIWTIILYLVYKIVRRKT